MPYNVSMRYADSPGKLAFTGRVKAPSSSTCFGGHGIGSHQSDLCCPKTYSMRSLILLQRQRGTSRSLVLVYEGESLEGMRQEPSLECSTQVGTTVSKPWAYLRNSLACPEYNSMIMSR